MLCVGNNASAAAAARRCMKRAKMNPLAARERATLKNTAHPRRSLALQRATEATPSKTTPGCLCYSLCSTA